MIRITLKEAQKNNYKNIIIKMTEDGLEYYRKSEKLYVVRWWLDENTYAERGFKSLKAAMNYGLKKLLNFDINYYEDKNNRYWSKQYQFINGELIGEEEQ